MQIIAYDSIVNEKRELARDIFELVLALKTPVSISFKAGQFINVHIPDGDKVLMRPYSIASSPSEKHAIALCFKKVPDGKSSNYLANLDIGDEIKFTGVFGQFGLREESTRDILFLAGGVGIAPIYSMIRYLYEKTTFRKADLYFSVKTEKDLFYYDELKMISEKNPGFRLTTCITREDHPSASHFAGRIQTCLEKNLTNTDNLEAYICGRKELVDDCKSFLLNKSLSKEYIYTEKFF